MNFYTNKTKLICLLKSSTKRRHVHGVFAICNRVFSYNYVFSIVTTIIDIPNDKWTKNVEFCFCIFDKFSDDIQLKMNLIPGKQMNYMT